MDHSQQICQEIELDVSGGVSVSVFVKTETLLFRSMEATDLQKSLKLISRQKGSPMEGFHSVMDWLYVSTFGPRAWSECMRFYSNQGPPLRELYTVEEIERFDTLLLSAVHVLEDCLFVRERWNSFVARMNREYAGLLNA